MCAERSAHNRRVLLLPPTSRDGEATHRLLVSAGIDCMVCGTLEQVCGEAVAGAAAIVVPEEVVLSDSHELLADCVRRQPVWSDFPIIVLTRAGAESPAVERALATLGNVSLIERPMRVSTLLSVVRASLRHRERQYEVRDALDERQALLESERSARAEADRAGRMKDDFLATLGHELRTPLNAILGWSTILRNGGENADDLKQGLDTIERNARAQTQIIEDLLDMSRIISGKVRLDMQPLDLAAVVQAAVETARPAADAKSVRLKMVLDPQTTGISGDPNRLQQVLWNLLSNAIKFTPRGGWVHVLLERVNAEIEISVNDSGEGIDPQFLPHVFDRFRQADASTTRRYGGLGLGLSIVKQLVELHGGTVRATSEGAGQGSTFTVALPMSFVQPIPQSQGEGKDSQKTVPAVTPNLCVKIAGVKVLVVDDEPDSRALVTRLLENCQAVVTTAASANEAVERVEADRPDVLVSDIGMPGEDGYSLMRRVRALGADRGGAVPALALTAYARAEDRVRAVVAGYQMHIAKPVEPAELVTMVASLAGRTGEML